MQPVDRPDDEAAITRRINALCGLSDAAESELPTLIYNELKSLARRQFARERGAQTLSTTALVHEAWIRLSSRCENFADRGHFYRYAAKVMRHILVDRARRKSSERHGGGMLREDVAADQHASDDIAADLLGLDRALTELQRDRPQLGEIVELRFFAGLSVAEVAEQLDINERTVVRNWRAARAMIYHALERDDDARATS